MKQQKVYCIYRRGLSPEGHALETLLGVCRTEELAKLYQRQCIKGGSTESVIIEEWQIDKKPFVH